MTGTIINIEIQDPHFTNMLNQILSGIDKRFVLFKSLRKNKRKDGRTTLLCLIQTPTQELGHFVC